MGKEELNGQAHLIEQAVYIEWSKLHYARIARLAYQNGVAFSGLEAFQKDVFQRLYLKLASLSEAETDLLETAVGRLQFHWDQSQGQPETPVLRFAEDQALHAIIQGLQHEKRLPLTLFYFNGVSIESMPALLDQPLEAILSDIQQALNFLQKELQAENRLAVEKRLEWLGKSYGRFQLIFDEESLFHESVEDGKLRRVPEQRPKLRMKKSVAAIIGMATIFMAGVIGASFIMPDENWEPSAEAEANGDPVTAQTIKAWKAEYEEIRSSSAERLGLDTERFEQLEYVQKADAELDRTLGRKNVKKFKEEPGALHSQMDKVLRDIETPKGMFERSKETGLLAEESEEFLQSFALKTKELMAIADSTLLEHENALKEEAISNALSPEMLRAHKDQYPEKVQKLIGSLDESMLMLIPHPHKAAFISRRNLQVIYESEFNYMDILGYQYLSMLENEPYYDETDLLIPMEIMPSHLSQMERYLIDTKPESEEIYPEVETAFYKSFWLSVKGSKNNAVFDRNGVVKQQYQVAWKNMLRESVNPVISLMLPIVEEMEASGWRKSAHYDALVFSSIEQALQSEKKGELAKSLPNGDISIESAVVGMSESSYENSKILYSQFTKTYDMAVLRGVPPEEILLLFHYANHLKDPETMWHLLADDKLKPPIDQFVQGWKQQPDITDVASYLEIMTEAVYRHGRTLYIEPQISYKEPSTVFLQGPVLVMEKDRIWLVRNQMFESYALQEDDSFEENIGRLYSAYAVKQKEKLLDSMSPGEIAGIFILAAEKSDFKTMYSLMDERAKSQSLQSFEGQIKERDMPKLSKIHHLTFNLDLYSYEIDEKRGLAQLDLGSHSEDSYNYHELMMVETEQGWRIGELNMY